LHDYCFPNYLIRGTTEGDNHRAILACTPNATPPPATLKTLHKNDHKHAHLLKIVSTSSIMSNSNDAIHDLFDWLPRQRMPLFQLKGSARYRFGWDDDSKKSDWRADGYRWCRTALVQQSVRMVYNWRKRTFGYAVLFVLYSLWM